MKKQRESESLRSRGRYRCCASDSSVRSMSEKDCSNLSCHFRVVLGDLAFFLIAPSQNLFILHVKLAVLIIQRSIKRSLPYQENQQLIAQHVSVGRAGNSALRPDFYFFVFEGRVAVDDLVNL